MSTLIERMTSAGSEGARRATGDLADGGAAAAVRDPEVSEKAKRRRFSAEYKLRIVREADACKGDGDVAALLRREGCVQNYQEVPFPDSLLYTHRLKIVLFKDRSAKGFAANLKLRQIP